MYTPKIHPKLCIWYTDLLFKVIGKDLEVCSVEFRNKIGELKPREKQEIELIICANKEVCRICMNLSLD